MEFTRAVIRVYGRVQGVGFRYYTLIHARRLGVRGYVKNLSDGSVVIVAEGLEDRIRELVRMVRRGPLLARVDRVQVVYGKPKMEYSGFFVLR